MSSYLSRLNHALKLGSFNPGQLGGKSLSGVSRLISSVGDVQFLRSSSTCSVTKSGSVIVHEWRDSFVSRSFSTSGSSNQIGKYNIDRLLSNSPFQEVPMAAAASGSKALLSDCCLDGFTLKNRHVSNSAKQVCFSFNKRSLYSGSRASMNLNNRKPSNDNLHCGYFMFDAMRKSCDYNLLIGLGCRRLHTSSSAFVSVGASPDSSVHGSGCDQQLVAPTVSSDQEGLGDKTLKLVSGSCYLPHPDKVDTGGEDAHFICIDEQATGVADGVGGWAEVGINAGLYAQELMSNSVIAIVNEPKGSIDPARVLEKAHSSTKAQGSSTACIIALTDEGIQAINLGDSGFIVVRDGSTVYRSPVQQHGFNFPYQLECGRNGDLPSSGQVLTVPVAPGDVIVAGTDRLFDNLFNSDITEIIVQAVRGGLEPQGAAQKIAALARQRALDEKRTSPFSKAAREAGFQYHGGKLDDVTVVVSYITNSTTTTNSLSVMIIGLETRVLAEEFTALCKLDRLSHASIAQHVTADLISRSLSNEETNQLAAREDGP